MADTPAPSSLIADVRALQQGQIADEGAAPPAPAPAPPAGPAPAPAPPGAPPPAPASPPPAPALGGTEQQRVADAQARMHEATREAAEARRASETAQQEVVQLRERMGAILANPAFMPAMDHPDYQPQPGEDPLAQAFKDYQAAPNDEAAFRVMYERFRGLAAEDQRRQFAAMNAQAMTRQRVQVQQQALRTEIESTVQQTAPDVPTDLFWRFARDAEARVPPFLTDPAVRLEWQVGEAIRLARTHRDEWLKPYREQGQQAEALTRQAQVITPVRSATPTAAAAEAPLSLVDSIKAMQRQRLDAAPS